MTKGKVLPPSAAHHSSSLTGPADPQLLSHRPRWPTAPLTQARMTHSSRCHVTGHPSWWRSTGFWLRQSVCLNRAWVHFYLRWKGRRSRPLALILAHTLHPTASSCIVVSTDEGLNDGQALYILFSEKTSNLPSQHLYTNPFRATAKRAYGALRNRWNSQLLSEAKVYPYLSWNYTNSYIW